MRAARRGKSTPRAKVGLGKSSSIAPQECTTREGGERRRSEKGPLASHSFWPPTAAAAAASTPPFFCFFRKLTSNSPLNSPLDSNDTKNKRGRPHASVDQVGPREAGQAAAPAGVQGLEVSSFFLLLIRQPRPPLSFLSFPCPFAHTNTRALFLCFQTGTRKRPRSSRRGAPRARPRGSSACCLCRRAPQRG